MVVKGGNWPTNYPEREEQRILGHLQREPQQLIFSFGNLMTAFRSSAGQVNGAADQ